MTCLLGAAVRVTYVYTRSIDTRHGYRGRTLQYSARLRGHEVVNGYSSFTRAPSLILVDTSLTLRWHGLPCSRSIPNV